MLQQMHTRMATVGMGLALMLFVCGTALAQDVTTNSMPGTDFTKFHTYKWVTIQGATYPNQIVDAQIKQAVDSQLAAKGLTKTDSDKADLYVGYQASIDQQRQWNAYGMGGGLRWGGGMATAQSSTIHIGDRNSDKADLYVGYQASIDQQRQWNAYGMGGGLRWGGGMATAQSSTIHI